MIGNRKADETVLVYAGGGAFMGIAIAAIAGMGDAGTLIATAVSSAVGIVAALVVSKRAS